jgi:glycosyltransferase involved in cell wall biosynthesis
MPETKGNKGTVDVSIVAANFNNGRYLADFIRSIESSTVYPMELILVDDGSTDDSHEVLDSFKHITWLKPFMFGSNRGFTAALNAGVDKASGKYIMRADPDDIFLPERIEKQFDYMEQHPSIAVSGCNVFYFKGKPENVINVSSFPESYSTIYEKYCKGEHGVQHPTVISRSDIMKRYPYGKEFPGEDYELFARMIKEGVIITNQREPLYMMRVHEGSSTSNLNFEGIRRTFRTRDRIFGSRTSGTRMRMYYSFIKNYRKYQLAENVISKYLYLLASSLSYPQKLLNRLNDANPIARYHR